MAVDIGGTQLRAALFTAHSRKPLKVARLATHQGGEPPLDRLIRLVASLWPAEDGVACIGVAAPGPLDPYQGILFAAPNIPGWVNLPLRQALQERFGAPVRLGNDANLAALGEWRFGAAQGHSHVVYLTVSTGIGGGIIVENRLLLGVRGLAAEVGHITVMADGPLCGCGQRGHLEAGAAGPAIAAWVSQEIAQGVPSRLASAPAVTARDVADAAQHGDALAIAALARAGAFMGQAIAGFLHIFNPSIVVIGGGVTRSGDLFLDPLRASLREHVITPQYLAGLTVATAALGDEVGLIGAYALALEHAPTP